MQNQLGPEFFLLDKIYSPLDLNWIEAYRHHRLNDIADVEFLIILKQ